MSGFSILNFSAKTGHFEEKDTPTGYGETDGGLKVHHQPSLMTVPGGALLLAGLRHAALKPFRYVAKDIREHAKLIPFELD